MRQPDVVERLATLGFDAILSTPDEFNARIRIDIQKWANVIRAANIKVE
jgi:tripartite-type tricarboxylate transporter receptor subunit TctC